MIISKVNSPVRNIPYPNLAKCSDMLRQSGGFSLKCFEEIPEPNKNIVRAYTPVRLKELAKLNCSLAIKIKDYYDEVYGKNNYVIIAMGRSCSVLAETIKMLGVDVKLLPLSGAKYPLFPSLNNKTVYKNFLSSIGLSDKTLSRNKDKTYILFDYRYTGRSLDNTYDFLSSNDILGKHNNFVKDEVNIFLDSKEDKIFEFARFKEFSKVGELYSENFDRAFEQANSITSKEGKSNMFQFLRNLFKFNVLDLLNNKSYEDYNLLFETKAMSIHYNQDASKKTLRNAISGNRKLLKELISSRKEES